MLKIETKLDESGKITIPDECRRATGLETGDTVILMLDKGELRVIPPAEAIRRAQSLVRRYVSGDRMLSEELIRERHVEPTLG